MGIEPIFLFILLSSVHFPRPGPNTGPVECKITRVKGSVGKMYPVYNVGGGGLKCNDERLQDNDTLF